MSADANRTDFTMIEIFKKPALFTELRVDRDSIPKGMYAYDLHHGDDMEKLCTIEDRVVVNHYGTVLLNRPISLGKNGYRTLARRDLSFADSYTTTLNDYLKEHPPRTVDKER